MKRKTNFVPDYKVTNFFGDLYRFRYLKICKAFLKYRIPRK